MIGRTLGHYRIVEQVGAGGMGVVYRAHDERLGRDVALKVLPDAFARDADRMARFEREARLLASLNHPNIAAIYGLEESGGVRAIAMEFVEGPSLADRLRTGPISLEEALPIARQIADALEAAHEKGIIHRDLKPANVKVTADGKVKVLDFGLAKALVDNSGAIDLSASPTISEIVSKTGVILGTTAYMSPEQARGKPLDKRTDVWSFGCLLYEMLTGQMAFRGDTVSDSIAYILGREPDWSALPPMTPPAVRRLLTRCLCKNPQQRMHDVADVRIEIEDALEEPAGAVQVTAAELRRGRWRMGLMLATVLLIGAAGGIVLWSTLARDMGNPSPTTRTNVSIGAWGLTLTGGGIAVSPDGQTLVFVARAAAGPERLYVRRGDEWEPLPLKGTEGASDPFFSPDGEWIAFRVLDKGNEGSGTTGGRLVKVPVRGGTPQLICVASVNARGSWGRDGRIIFGAWPATGLWSVSAEGGTPQALTRVPGGSSSVRFVWPEILPGGEHVVFTVWREGQPSIAILSLRSGEVRPLIASGSRARYLPSGHLIYEAEGNVLAVAFDAERLEKRGDSLVVIENFGNDARFGKDLDVSLTGTLAYAPSSLDKLVWKDRRGAAEPLSLHARRYTMPKLSPDGRRLVDHIQDGTTQHLWIGNVDSEPLTPLTSGSDDVFSLFTPDGKWVLFTSGQKGRYNIFRTPANGGGNAERLTDSPHDQKATSWSPRGDVLLFNDIDRSRSPGMDLDIWQLEFDRLGRPGVARPFVKTRFSELEGVFSPDGRWVAYESDETGRMEIYVQAYPGPGARTRVSIEGGVGPAWNARGGELFYQSQTAVMAQRMENGRPVGPPTQLFAHASRQPRTKDWDVSADGQRFLVVERAEAGSSASQINIVANWFEELKRRVPSGKK